MKCRAVLLLAVVSATVPTLTHAAAVKTGIEVLQARNFDILQGKRVGLITNPTGVDSQLRSTIDILHRAPGVKLAALMGPEHGVRGDYAAGDTIQSASDAATGLPVYSLYGDTRKPTPEMLRGLDVLVYDIQDIGCRSYTYISTLGLAMQAAAEAGIEFVVLDRPNPLGGVRIEGNLVAPGAESFVGQYAIPYVYGLTCGELARLLNEEGMLRMTTPAPRAESRAGDRRARRGATAARAQAPAAAPRVPTPGPARRCRLTVVPMQGWKRSMRFADTGLFWVPPSPHIPRVDSSLFYVATGMMGELQVISEGVGYPLPFEIFAAEWIDPTALCAEIEKQPWEGVRFRPITFKPYYTGHKEKVLRGVQIYLPDPARVDLAGIQFRLMEIHHRLYPGKNPFKLASAARLEMFDKVSGGPRLRELFSRRMRYADVEPFLKQGAAQFRATAQKYYLYE